MDAPLVLGEYPGEVSEWMNVGEPLPGNLTTAEMVMFPLPKLKFKCYCQLLNISLSMSICMSMDSMEDGSGSMDLLRKRTQTYDPV